MTHDNFVCMFIGGCAGMAVCISALIVRAFRK